VKSRFGVASLAKKSVSFVAMWQFFRLCSKAFGFLIETFREGQDVLETATLHDTTSLLRVLTVGLQVPIIIYR
jgi:hypothetical protein